jgi:hypothetical protein
MSAKLCIKGRSVAVVWMGGMIGGYKLFGRGLGEGHFWMTNTGSGDDGGRADAGERESKQRYHDSAERWERILGPSWTRTLHWYT